MGRVSTFSDEVVFSAVGDSFTRNGDLRLQELAAKTNVSIGSLYHRYGSREGLLASAWLDALYAFQEQFIQAISSDKVRAGEDTALVTPRFCRSEPDRARILTCCRLEEFTSPKTPSDSLKEIDEANQRLFAAVKQFARKKGYSHTSCQLGMVAFPLAAVKMYLPHKPVPKEIDRHVTAAYRSAIKISK